MQQWPFDPRYENALDKLGSLLFGASTVLTFALAYALEPGGALLMLCLAVLFTFGWMIIIPLKESTRLAKEHEVYKDAPEGVYLRRTATGSTSALDLLWAKIIFFEDADLRPHYNNWRSLIHHEATHLRNNDTRIFLLSAVLGFGYLGQILVLLLVLFGIFLTEPIQENEVDSIQAMAALTVFIVLQIVLYLVWIKRSLHRREFNADRYAFEQSGQHYVDWMDRTHRRHMLKQKEQSFKLSVWCSKMFRALTHPNIAARCEALKLGAPKVKIGPWRSIILPLSLGVICLFFGSGAYIGWQVGYDFAFKFMSLPCLIAVSFVAFSYLSLTTMRFLSVSRPIEKALWPLRWVAVIIMPMYLLNLVFGPDAGNVLAVAKSALALGIWVFSFGVILVIGFIFVSKLPKILHFSILLHAVVGAIAFLGSRAFTGGIFWIF
ncbi:MAG: M48 family metalloprotease [Sulfitobacter sp.]